MNGQRAYCGAQAGRPTVTDGQIETHLLYARDLALLLVEVLLALLAGLVEPADEPLDVPLVLEAGLVLPARGRVVGDVDVAVFAEVLFVRDPVFRHGQAG